MGLQESNCKSAGLFLLGCLHIHNLVIEYKYIKTNIFNKYFKDCNNKTNWTKIYNIIDSHSATSNIPTGQTPSKDIRTNDGMSTQYNINFSEIHIQELYNEINTNLLFLNESIRSKLLYDIELNKSRPYEAITAYRIWEMICISFESLYEIDTKIRLLINSIIPLYYNLDKPLKSPGQLFFYGDKYNHGSLVDKYIPRNFLGRSSPPILEDIKESDFINNNRRDNVFYEDYENPILYCEGGLGSGDYGPIDFADIPWNYINLQLSEFIPYLLLDYRELYYNDLNTFIFQNHSIPVYLNDTPTLYPGYNFNLELPSSDDSYNINIDLKTGLINVVEPTKTVNGQLKYWSIEYS